VVDRPIKSDDCVNCCWSLGTLPCCCNKPQRAAAPKLERVLTCSSDPDDRNFWACGHQNATSRGCTPTPAANIDETTIVASPPQGVWFSLHQALFPELELRTPSRRPDLSDEENIPLLCTPRLSTLNTRPKAPPLGMP
jgi:hypothetical protein